MLFLFVFLVHPKGHAKAYLNLQTLRETRLDREELENRFFTPRQNKQTTPEIKEKAEK